MNSMQPIVKPLSRWRRKVVFGLLLLAFVVSLPAFIFYAAGYRYDLSSPAVLFTATGGFYISAETDGSQIFIDDQEILNARTFRNASYIQGLEPGLHQVHVQAPGFHTWVKNLEVLPHIVTEAEAFNLPIIPQVRLITPYQAEDGTSIIFTKTSSSTVLTNASATTPYRLSTSTATSSLQVNQEYALLEALFAEQASTSLAITRQGRGEEEKKFNFATTTLETNTVMATTTIEREGLRLFKRGDDVFVSLLTADKNDIPFYFCREELVASTSVELLEVTAVSNTPLPTREICRFEIQIDRKGEKVIAFDFHPTDVNFVLLQLESGLYMVEVDDRAWQNSQPVYVAPGLAFVVNKGGIYLKEKGTLFEVLLDIPK
jgi:hypothetical protein